MFESDCIFCKIIQKKVSAKIIKESEYSLVIEDMSPKAPIHYLILPKKHIININYLSDKDSKYAADMIKIARNIAQEIKEEKGLKEPLSFNLISNNGIQASQSVFHMHFHFIAGKNIYIDGFQL
ncbi:HIT domain-containing protein [Candidatus Babeliales bacterium]|nr:HIT domain-containing protein [Candidatus Babeliales bacterium]